MPQMMPIAWFQMFFMINLALLVIVMKSHFVSSVKTLTRPMSPKFLMKWEW